MLNITNECIIMVKNRKGDNVIMRKKFIILVSLICIICCFVQNNNNIVQNELITKKSFYMGNGVEENSEKASDELTEEDYFEIDNELLNDALVESSLDDYEDCCIKKIDDIYGTSIDKSMLCDIAKIQIASYLGLKIKDFTNITSIVIESSVILYDANDVNTYVGYNFKSDGNVHGYITIATHTKAPLIKEVTEGFYLPVDQDKIYYLSEGEFYVKNGENYKTLDGKDIEKNDFNELKKLRCQNYYSLTTDLLASIELDSMSTLNNITYLLNGIEDVDDLTMGKQYDGQNGEAYGYGGIDSPKKYLKDRYGGTVSNSSISKFLSMQSFLCKDFENKNNCTLVAITRVLCYYYKQGYSKLPSSYKKIYSKVLKVAKSYGYNEKDGTWPTKINNIIDKVLDDYGYPKSYSNGIYLWTFSKQVQGEIDKNRPVIMNIARGYYGNHSVTVCGYNIYKTKHNFLWTSYTKTHHMICVYDGWYRHVRYIDYEAFAYDLISAGFGSFNTVIMKK